MRSNSTYLTILLTCFSCSLATLAHADVSFSLSSSANLTQLKVGDTITVEVNLSDIESGPDLVFVGTTVDFDGALFEPTAIHAGPIVPNGDSALSSILGLGSVDAYFETFSDQTSDHLVSSGIFYSFDLVAIAPGDGLLDLSFWLTAAYDPESPAGSLIDSSAEAGLPFFIGVPEPHSFLLAASGGLAAAWMIRHRRRAAL